MPRLADALALASALGLGEAQGVRGTGLGSDGGYAYLDTATALGATFELVELPKEGRAPAETYP